jgi:hypothetical protein
MKRLFSISVLLIACTFFAFGAGPSKLNKMVGNWKGTTDFNGQIIETSWDLGSDEKGIFAIVDFGDRKSNKYYLDENKILNEGMNINSPEFGVRLIIKLKIVDIDNMTISIDAGGILFDTDLDRKTSK